jgi:hypothetical protein
VLPLPAAVQPAYKGRTRRARSQVPVVEGKRHAVWCAQDIAGCSPCTNSSYLLNLQPGGSAAG